MAAFNFNSFFAFLSFVALAKAHIVAWHIGMYCLNGTTPGIDDQSTNAAVNPLFNLTRNDWWFHHYNLCDEFPPAPGDFLELPSGGTFVVEHAVNRAFTTLAFDGANVADFGDGEDHPGLGEPDENGEWKCIPGPNIHAYNESTAAGTVFAISYQSELSAVTPENLVVFSVLYFTPWKRLATYSVPPLPACPPDGCICAWGWIPNGCGVPNMYMFPYRCMVTGVTGSRAVATPAQPAKWCRGNQSDCVPGPKQMSFWNQLEGNNVQVPGGESPCYDSRMGFYNGAQLDIFMEPGSAPTQTIAPKSKTPQTTNTSSTTRISANRMTAFALVALTSWWLLI